MVLVLDSLLYPLLKPTHSLQAHRVGFCVPHSARAERHSITVALSHVLSTPCLLSDCRVVGDCVRVSIGLAILRCDTYTTGVGARRPPMRSLLNNKDRHTLPC